MTPAATGTAAALACLGGWTARHLTAPAVRRWAPGRGAQRSAGGLSVRTWGDGESAVVLLHGLVATGDTFGAGFDDVSPNGRVVVPDLLGFGRSVRRGPARFSLDAHLDALDAMLAGLGLADARLVVCGHSLGGSIALRWAARRAEQVDRVVTWAPALFRSHGEARRRVSAFKRWGSVLAVPNPVAAVVCQQMCTRRPGVTGWLYAAALPSLPTQLARQCAHHTWDAYAAMATEVLLDDGWQAALARLDAAGVPVVLATGARDRLSVPDLATTLAARHGSRRRRRAPDRRPLPAADAPALVQSCCRPGRAVTTGRARLVPVEPQVLTARELNRATLARQLLLGRTTGPVPSVVSHLVGLQAQAAVSPFVSLWSRVEGLSRDDVAALVEARDLLKATLMRGTLHLTAAADYPWLRSTLQPVLTDALTAVAKNRGGVPDIDAMVTAARTLLADGPRSFADITDLLTSMDPEGDAGIMRYAVRTHLPMVQVPTSARWCFPGNPTWTTAEQWLGRPVHAEPDPRALVRRYLTAFGPGSAADVGTWSYLPGVDAVVDSMRDELVVHLDTRGRELFDVPGAPLPGGDVDAPPRFLPEFDNLLLSHVDRTRFVPDSDRKKVYLPGLRVAATLLVDGVVAGTWAVSRRGKALATLTVTPFRTLPRRVGAEVVVEAERLVRFVVPDVRDHAVEVAT